MSAYASHAVVSLRRDGLTGVHVIPRDEHGDLRTGARHRLRRAAATSSTRPASPDYDTPTIRLGYESMLTPDSVYDYDLATGELIAAQAHPGAGRPDVRPVRPGPLRPGARLGHRRRRHPGPAVHRPPRRRAAGRVGARPCSTATARTRSRWTRASPSPGCRCSTAASCTRSPTSAAAASWAARWYEQGKMLTKINTFTDFVACADYLVDGRLHQPGPAGRPRRQRRRAADGRGGQPGARPVPGHPRRGAVRRPADHDPGPRSAADRDRVGGVGRPAARPRGLRVHEVLQPVRERRRPATTRPSWPPPA